MQSTAARTEEFETMTTGIAAPAFSPSQSLNLGVIGNGAIAALIDQRARIVWGCFPRFDSAPVFCSLLMGSADDEYGYFGIELVDQARTEQRYLPNSAIIETIIYDLNGGAVRITDFAPRFKMYERMYHPTKIVRRLECISGLPRVIVRLRPAANQGAAPAERHLGSNHIRFATDEMMLRMTTDGSVTMINKEIPFVLQGDMTMVFGPDDPLQDSPGRTGKKNFDETLAYWRDWVRDLALPFEWQEVVIRSAITLKLCALEETGGVVAALTTSVPEYSGTVRNWDYRFCWLRDTFFVVQILNRLGAIKTMENYINYVKNIVAIEQGGDIQPLYGLCYQKEIEETTAPWLRGYRDNAPVRFGNAAYSQIQNDSYGSIILALAQSFFDLRRDDHSDDLKLFSLLEPLAEKAEKAWNTPDASLWEYRGIAHVHTYSAAMCWVACDRIAKIAEHLQLKERAQIWVNIADKMQAEILQKAWSEEKQSFTSAFGGEDVDASLLLLPEIGIVAATDERYLKTFDVVEKTLRHGKELFRYRHKDDFGFPETSFTVCTLWYARALKRIGRCDEAREIFTHVLERRNHLGLLSEDIHPESGELWGNFPQTYSMVGLIQVALSLSKPWEQMF